MIFAIISILLVQILDIIILLNIYWLKTVIIKNLGFAHGEVLLFRIGLEASHNQGFIINLNIK